MSDSNNPDGRSGWQGTGRRIRRPAGGWESPDVPLGHNAAVPYFQTFDPQDDARAQSEIQRIDALSTHHDAVWRGARIRWRRFGPAVGSEKRSPLVLLHGGHGTLRRLTVEMVNWRAAVDRDAEQAALLHNLAALMLHDKAAIDPLAFAIHDISCHATRFRSKEVSLAGGLQQALDALGGPQLLLWGEFDVTADPRPLVAQLVAGHPQREGAVIDGAGHWAQFERAAAVNDRLLRFLD